MTWRPDGYRYVRGYGRTNNPAWALYEVQQGKAKRVGTARTNNEYLAFLGCELESPLQLMLDTFDPFKYEKPCYGMLR